MNVACPKCATPQEVGASIAPEGIRVVCASCGVKFVVRRAATVAMTGGARYFVRRKTGNSFGPFVEGVIASMLGQKKLDGSEEVSQDGKTWASIRTVPAFAAALGPAAATGGRTFLSASSGGAASSTDLPAPREAIPKASDLPAPREAIPRSDNLPAPR
jgi:hypothetical protein